MQMVQLYVQSEAAHATVNELGKLGTVQFRDMNEGTNAFQRSYVSDIKRCEDMQRQLRLVKQNLDKKGCVCDKRDAETTIRVDDLQTHLAQVVRELGEANSNGDQLQRNLLAMEEHWWTVHKSSLFFQSPPVREDSGGDEEMLASPLLERESGAPDRTVSFLTGVISSSKKQAFERVLFRSTRGNCFQQFADIEEPMHDPATGKPQHKSVMIVFFSGIRLKSKISKICQTFGINLYSYPDSPEQRTRLQKQVSDQKNDLKMVLRQSEKSQLSNLRSLALQFYGWDAAVKKEKSVFHCLNMFNVDHSRNCLIASLWIPTEEIPAVREALRQASIQSNSSVPSILEPVPTALTPPTYFVTNKLTNCFQLIVDAYGIPRYGEINPTPFTVITFPFLFAIMFGDVGHGLLLTLFALGLVLNEDKLSKMDLGEIGGYPFGGRYCLLLMGVFSIYTGLLYNDCFGCGLNLFGTQYQKGTDGSQEFSGTPYVFGIDPVWTLSTNQLSFMNSFKMKLSVVFGVVQMTAGVCVSLVNALHFRSSVDIWCGFVPQMIFMMSIFGHLVFCIFYKWATVWEHGKAPSLITMLIKFFMSPGKVDKAGGEELYPGQAGIQLVLMLMAFIAVPWMLFPKPFILKARHEREQREKMGDGYSALELQAVNLEHGEDDDDEHGGFEFGEEMVHQIIHTIEYVLGCISNTASYLRLWALSLAHAELSKVFWEKLFYGDVGIVTIGVASMSNPQVPYSTSVPSMIAGFFAWACCTLVVLLIMEQLSAFLHALRLHWVEFQNKFYFGDGIPFTPHSFAKILAEEDI